MEVQAEFPMEELLAGIRNDIEAFRAEAGLKINQGVMEEEISRIGHARAVCVFLRIEKAGAGD